MMTKLALWKLPDFYVCTQAWFLFDDIIIFCEFTRFIDFYSSVLLWYHWSMIAPVSVK